MEPKTELKVETFLLFLAVIIFVWFVQIQFTLMALAPEISPLLFAIDLLAVLYFLVDGLHLFRKAEKLKAATKTTES